MFACWGLALLLVGGCVEGVRLHPDTADAVLAISDADPMFLEVATKVRAGNPADKIMSIVDSVYDTLEQQHTASAALSVERAGKCAMQEASLEKPLREAQELLTSLTMQEDHKQGRYTTLNRQVQDSDDHVSHLDEEVAAMVASAKYEDDALDLAKKAHAVSHDAFVNHDKRMKKYAMTIADMLGILSNHFGAPGVGPEERVSTDAPQDVLRVPPVRNSPPALLEESSEPVANGPFRDHEAKQIYDSLKKLQDEIDAGKETEARNEQSSKANFKEAKETKSLFKIRRVMANHTIAKEQKEAAEAAAAAQDRLDKLKAVDAERPEKIVAAKAAVTNMKKMIEIVRADCQQQATEAEFRATARVKQLDTAHRLRLLVGDSTQRIRSVLGKYSALLGKS